MIPKSSKIDPETMLKNTIEIKHENGAKMTKSAPHNSKKGPKMTSKMTPKSSQDHPRRFRPPKKCQSDQKLPHDLFWGPFLGPFLGPRRRFTQQNAQFW